MRGRVTINGLRMVYQGYVSVGFKSSNQGVFLESNHKDTCHACGRTIAECSCDAVRERLRTLARKLIEAGHQAFRRSELHRARRLFARAVATDGAVSGGWEALGLCALALGDPKTSLIAWRAAERLDHGPEVEPWLASLQSGDVRDALVTYNSALGHARADNWGAALEGLAQVERRLPGFVPAVRLQGLVLTAMGKAESAQEVWERGLAACRDDEFLRCHATAIGAQVPQSSSIRVGAVTPMIGRSAAFGAGVLSVALVIGGISFFVFTSRIMRYAGTETCLPSRSNSQEMRSGGPCGGSHLFSDSDQCTGSPAFNPSISSAK